MTTDSSVIASPEAVSAEYAGFGRRLLAAIIDGVLLGVVSTILDAVVGSPAGSILSVVIGVGYFTYLEGSSGQTLGKSVMGIRVVDVDGGGAIGFGRAFVRYVGRLVSTVVIFLGYLWMLWDPHNQTWHDKFARSLVVTRN